MKYVIQSALLNNTELTYQIGQIIYNAQNDEDIVTNYDEQARFSQRNMQKFYSANSIFAFCDVFPSTYKDLPANRSLVVMRLHPDVAWLYNQIFGAEFCTACYSVQIYLKLMNCSVHFFDLETKETSLPYDLKMVKLQMPVIQRTELDFLEYQDLMKHLPIEDHVAYSEDATIVDIQGKTFFNAYDTLGYKPMTFADIQKLQEVSL